VHPGQAGHILVTSFMNRVQPLLRYRIGDYGILLSTPCSCGRGMPLMKLTGAKIIEMIKTENGRIFSAEIIDYINLALMKNSKIGIKQFRVTQKDLRSFLIEVVPDKQFNEQSKILFTKLFLEQIGEDALSLKFDVKEKIEPLPGGKLLYFQSEIT
jgi:phenylacetate-CoA ligase